jgi:hypothetical protein
LIGRDFVFHAEIAPTIPMVAEDLAEPVMAGGMIRTLERGTNDLLWTVWRIHANFSCTACTTLLYFVRDNTKSSFVQTGKSAYETVNSGGLAQNSDEELISKIVEGAISAYPDELANYLTGKETLANLFFGQAMKSAGGKANPAVLKAELEKHLRLLRSQQ